MGPYQALPLWVRVGVGAMVMKGHNTSPKILVSSPGHSVVGGSYSSVDIQSMYSIALADWVVYMAS